MINLLSKYFLHSVQVHFVCRILGCGNHTGKSIYNTQGKDIGECTWEYYNIHVINRYIFFYIRTELLLSDPFNGNVGLNLSSIRWNTFSLSFSSEWNANWLS